MNMVPRSGDEPVDIVVRVKRVTEKAVLVDQDGGTCWLPLSQLYDVSPDRIHVFPHEWEGKLRRLCVPLWLAMKHDLHWEECEWQSEEDLWAADEAAR